MRKLIVLAFRSTRSSLQRKVRREVRPPHSRMARAELDFVRQRKQLDPVASALTGRDLMRDLSPTMRQFPLILGSDS
jgi:hypothetical protein